MSVNGRTPTLDAGVVVGERYVVDRMLGEGGMARVYRAKQKGLERWVALKVLNPELVGMPLGRRRFLREARVAAELRHRGVVEIYDVGDDGNVAYIAMQLLDGDVLRDLLYDAQIALSLADSLEIGVQVAEVLEAAHEVSLTHRDLKPDNIFVLRTGDDALEVTVVDFGLAFIAGREDLDRMTRDNVVVGTPAYLAPEQASGGVVGPLADVYALGCLMYELVTGHLPFVGSDVNVLTQHLYVAPVRPRERAPTANLPPDLDDLIVAMLSKDPHQRPPATRVVEVLRETAGTLRGVRARGRDAVQLEGRAARMVSAAAPTIAADADLSAAAPSGEELAVSLVGSFPPDMIVGLAGNGVRALRMQPDELPKPGTCDLIVVGGDRIDELDEALRLGVPVLVSAAVSDIGFVGRLLRLGVQEVVRAPATVDEMARKLRRVFARTRPSGASTK